MTYTDVSAAARAQRKITRIEASGERGRAARLREAEPIGFEGGGNVSDVRRADVRRRLGERRGKRKRESTRGRCEHAVLGTGGAVVVRRAIVVMGDGEQATAVVMVARVGQRIAV